MHFGANICPKYLYMKVIKLTLFKHYFIIIYFLDRFIYSSNSANRLNAANKLKILNLLINLAIMKFSFSFLKL